MYRATGDAAHEWIGVSVLVTYYALKLLTKFQKGDQKHYDPSGR
jgi:hypothetical protein